MGSRRALVVGLPLVLASGIGYAADGGAAAPTSIESEIPITGGTTTAVGAWPDVVAILGTQGYCSGTLIAPDVVLTAGHCADISPTSVRIDTTDYNGTAGVTAQVQSVTAYPSWATTYDVSVVVLTAPVQGVTPRTVAAACTFGAGWTNGASVHLVGFGATDVQAQTNNSRQYEVSVPLVDAMCADGDGCKTGVSPGGEFVAGGAGKDSCNGDSGGPVFMDTPRGVILVGAVSRATSSATSPCGDGGIYVRTDKVLAWIEQTTGRTIATDSCDDATDPGDGSGRNAGSGSSGSEPQPGEAPGAVVGGCSVGRGGDVGGAIVLLGFAGTVRRRRR